MVLSEYRLAAINTDMIIKASSNKAKLRTCRMIDYLIHCSEPKQDFKIENLYDFILLCTEYNNKVRLKCGLMIVG